MIDPHTLRSLAAVHLRQAELSPKLSTRTGRVSDHATPDASSLKALPTEAPSTEAHFTEAPFTEAPSTEAPSTEAPSTEAPSSPSVDAEAPELDAFAERRALIRARRLRRLQLQRRNRLQERVASPVDVAELTVSLAVPQTATCLPAKAVDQILRPPCLFGGKEVCCLCPECSRRAEIELRMDRLWLQGEHEEALAAELPDCHYMLPSVALQLRAQRPWVPKSVLWQTPADQATPSERRQEFLHRYTMSLEEHQISDWTECEHEIEKVERQIRRQIGAADWAAEVVIIVSTLRVSFAAYASGCRILRFLEAKGVDHITIDINADIGQDSMDFRLVRKWLREGRLHRDAWKVAAGGKMNALAPQILVDGVPIGGYEELMTLEDEHDLDFILAREACPNCLRDREPPARTSKTAEDASVDPLGLKTQAPSYCRVCGAQFLKLVSRDYLEEEEIMYLLQRNELNSSRIKAPTPRDFEKRRRQLGFARLDEDVASWYSPEKAEKFGVPSIGFTVDFE